MLALIYVYSMAICLGAFFVSAPTIIDEAYAEGELGLAEWFSLWALFLGCLMPITNTFMAASLISELFEV